MADGNSDPSPLDLFLDSTAQISLHMLQIRWQMKQRLKITVVNGFKRHHKPLAFFARLPLAKTCHAVHHCHTLFSLDSTSLVVG